jgi:hypothetical protein
MKHAQCGGELKRRGFGNYVCDACGGRVDFGQGATWSHQQPLPSSGIVMPKAPSLEQLERRGVAYWRRHGAD